LKVLLINSPWISTQKQYGLKSGTRWGALRNKDRFLPYYPYPYFLASATAVLKQAGYETYIKDAIGEELTKEECLNYIEELDPDLVVSDVFTPSIYVDLEFIKEVKKRINCLTVCSGVHASGLPNEVLKNDFVDFIAMWEMDYTLRELVQFLDEGRCDFHNIKGLAYKKNGKINVNNRRPAIQNLDELPFPEREQLPMHNYSEPFSKSEKVAKITSSRGCPFSCSFCVESSVFKQSYKRRSIALVIEEIKKCKERYGIDEVYFDDPMILKDRAVEIANAFIDSKINVRWCSAHIYSNPWSLANYLPLPAQKKLFLVTVLLLKPERSKARMSLHNQLSPSWFLQYRSLIQYKMIPMILS